MRVISSLTDKLWRRRGGYLRGRGCRSKVKNAQPFDRVDLLPLKRRFFGSFLSADGKK